MSRIKIEPVYSLNISPPELKTATTKIENRINGIYPPFEPPETYDNREIERMYSWRGHWMISPEERKWVEQKFEELLKDKDYKPQYYDENEFERMRAKRK